VYQNKNQQKEFKMSSTDDGITSSPFYIKDATAMPDGKQVQAGNLYMDDDTGSVVFQTFWTNLNGSVTLKDDGNKLEFTIDKCQPSITAQSYKDGASTEHRAVELRDSIVINVTPNTPTELSVISSSLYVTASPMSFDVYDIHDGSYDNQQHLSHATDPHEKGTDYTDTSVKGPIYVQYNGAVYLGEANRFQLRITDPNGDFRKTD
jgi:hypothetical protein